MLKAMRKNVKSLSPVLWIVIAAFVITIFAVWGGASRVGESGGNNKVVQIGKEVITAEEYFQVLRQRIEAMQKDYPELNLEMIKQLNLPQQILEQMIQQRLLLSLAKEMGLKVTDQELQEKIISYPVFQRDGKFIGFEEYKRILDWNHIPIGQFEDSLRDEILLTKVLQLLTAGVAVTEEEAWENYRNQNETAKIEYLVALAEGFPVSYDPNEEELRSYFESNKSKYQIPEKREGQLVFIKTEELKKQIIVSDSEIENYYRQHINQFKEPAKIKVSRIYLTYTEPDKQQVIEQSKNLKARLDSGEDFSELARIYSQDEKAADGGDWGYYDWQAFTAEEIQVINQLESGQVSEPVDLGYAISILKATEKMPEITKPLDEVKAMIQNNLLEQKAREQASERMEKLAKIAKKTRSLEQAAKREGLTSQETGLLTAGEPIPEIDSSGFLSQTLFELDEKELSSPIFTYEGVGLVQLTRIEPQHQASFEEVQTQVLNDFLNDIKKEKIKEKLASLIHDQAISWEKIAEENNLEYKRVETHKRGQYLSLIDNTEVLDNLVFSLPLNQPSEPFEIAEGYAVVRVLERKEVNREDFARVKDQEIENLLNEAREMFLYSYLQKAREDMKIKINYNLFTQVTDNLLGRIGG